MRTMIKYLRQELKMSQKELGDKVPGKQLTRLKMAGTILLYF